MDNTNTHKKNNYDAISQIEMWLKTRREDVIQFFRHFFCSRGSQMFTAGLMRRNKRSKTQRLKFENSHFFIEFPSSHMPLLPHAGLSYKGAQYQAWMRRRAPTIRIIPATSTLKMTAMIWPAENTILQQGYDPEIKINWYCAQYKHKCRKLFYLKWTNQFSLPYPFSKRWKSPGRGRSRCLRE